MSKLIHRTQGKFSLSTAIRARHTLRFAKRHGGLSFRQQMALGKAEKTLNRVFATAA